MQIYVTEPGHIDVQQAAALLGKQHQLQLGDTALTDAPRGSIHALMVGSQTVVDAAMLATLPRLRHIIRVGVGLDAIDVAQAKRRRIAVHHAPGSNSAAVVEYVLAMSLLTLRDFSALTPGAIATWDRSKVRSRQLSEQTFGIVGFGAIGQLLARRLEALGVRRIQVYDPRADRSRETETLTFVPLDTILAQCTIISFHVPLLPTTRHMLNEQNVQLLQPSALVINAARGGVVSEAAMIHRARQFPQSRYVADTVEGEPHVRAELLTHQNITVTPHIAGGTDMARRAALQQAIAAFLQARP